MSTMIHWDRDRLERFKSVYALCTSPDAVFTFEGNQFLCSYARYLIEYLEGRFNG